MYGKHIDYFRIECGNNVPKQVNNKVGHALNMNGTIIYIE